MIAQLIKIYIAFFLVEGCANDPGYLETGYDLMHPSKVFELGSDLREISGLAWHNGALFLVEDENGNVYTFDLQSGKVVDEKEVAGTGDFEGIEAVGDIIYILRSDSRIFSSQIIDISRDGREKVILDIGDDKNLEGFGYDPVRRMFLISSKKNGGKKPRKLYAVPIEDLEGKPQVVFEFDSEVLKEKLLENAESKASRLAMEVTFANYEFRPSAVAVHPMTKEIFILSHPMQQILVLTPDFKISHLFPLPTLRFPQPEGICFDSEGNLYISNEGRGGKAFILFFENQRR